VGAALAIAGACGGDDGSGADGGSELRSLEVLSPPGDEIGLPFYGEVTLHVKYSDPGGAPLPGAALAFELIASASEATGGSTLSASEATTDGSGVATITLVAGAERVNFRVQVTAARAQPALFYIAVSEEGFADLVATPEHTGFRAPGDFGVVEVRLHRAADLRCADLDPDAPPESVFPVRALGGFGADARYRNVGAGEPYAVVAWGQLEPDGVRVAIGCVELAPDQVRAGAETRFPLPVADRPPSLAAGVDIESTFNATPLAAAVSAAGPDVWAALDCPLGRAQLLIDCALDAQVSDGAVDCAVNGTGDFVDDVEATRGAVDAAGCRPPTSARGASLDALVDERIGPPWPVGDALAALLAARRAPLVSFRLSSRLGPGGATGAVVHRLSRLAVSAGDATAELDLVASDRPVIRQTAAASIDPATGRLAIGAHSFTVDYGRFAMSAFAELGLEPAGLGGRAADLGSALYGSVAQEDQIGCSALSRIVCLPIGRGAACLTAACGAASGQLDVLLDAWWQALEGAGLDLALTGSAPPLDSDGDLVLDGLGLGSGADGRGAWSAGMRLASGDIAALSGIFSGAVTPRSGRPARTPAAHPLAAPAPERRTAP
jgi:hypothetical protein